MSSIASIEGNIKTQIEQIKTKTMLGASLSEGPSFVDILAEYTREMALNPDKTKAMNLQQLLQAPVVPQTNPVNNQSAKPVTLADNPYKTNQPYAYSEIVNAMAEKYRLPAQLIKGVIQAESGFDNRAVSGAGAQGLMQLMPGTATALGVDNPFDPTQNIEGGTKYLAQLLERYNGNIPLALAAYNAGPSNVDEYNGIPPFEETQNYVQKVLGYSGLE